MKGFALSLLVFLMLASLPAFDLQAQVNVKALGFRFGADFNHFYQPERQTPLIDGYFSTVVLGAFYKHYYTNGLIEAGVNFVIKEQEGGLTFPVVMQNFRDTENSGMTAVEFQFMVGPRLWYFYPKFGFLASRLIHMDGMISDRALNLELTRWNLTIPVGFAFDFPTSFGSTGFGGYYDVGLSRIIESRDYQHGGRLRAWNFELHVAFRLGQSSARN